MSNTVNHDTLSELLRHLKFRAKVFLRADYCGAWAVDSSGDQRLPFHFVAKGEGWLHLAEQAPQHLAAGHLVLFPTDQRHLLSSSKTEPEPRVVNRAPPKQLEGDLTRLVCGYFEFDRRAAAPLLRGLPSVLSLNLNTEPTLAAIAKLWLEEAADEKMGGEMAVDLCAALLFIQLLRLSSFEAKGLVGALTNPQLGPVIASIHAQLSKQQSNAQLAQIANISESTLLNLFKQSMDMTPGEYIRHWRMHAAADLLRNSKKSITEIAEHSGYASEVSFRKAFSQFFSTPPAQYRRAGLNDSTSL